MCVLKSKAWAIVFATEVVSICVYVPVCLCVCDVVFVCVCLCVCVLYACVCVISKMGYCYVCVRGGYVQWGVATAVQIFCVR